MSRFLLSTLFTLVIITLTLVTFPSSTDAAYNSSQIINFNCTAGQYCLSPEYNATQKIKCPPSYYCPGGQSGQFCPRGYYCPTPKEKIRCPEGYYCPPASITPRSCSGLEYCPEGSSRYVSIGGIVLMVLLLPLILICTFIYNRYQGGKQKQAAPTPTDTPKDGSSPFGESSHNVAAVDELNIQFEHLRAGIKVDKVEKILIDDISGEFSAGRLTAIMGPSGAGKTTLISALMGKVPLLNGTVRINHAPDKLSHHRHAVGMVPQDDTMISSMTVHDILRHSADIRMPTRYDRDAREKRVDQVMELLGLSHVKNTVVGDVNVRGVSGGEKKRVNIGIELVANPRVLFLDEPTTGLDSTTSIDVTRVLRSIASLQVSVVAVLHQPRQEIFNLLDDLLLLAPGGKTVYFGPAKNTLNYFTKIGYPCPKNINPADYFIDVIAGKEGLPGTQRSASPVHDLTHDEKETTTTSDMEELANMHNNMIEHKAIIDYLTSQWEKYRDTATAKNAQPLGAIQEADEGTSEMTVVNPPKTLPTPPTPASSQPTEIIHFPNFFRQIYLYTYRSILQLIRNHATVSTELTLHLVAGLVIGIAFVYDYWFIPPLDPAYQRFCPQPLQNQCYKQPVKEQIQLMTTYTVMALGLTAAVIGNRNFGQEKANFFRESETGMSTLAYFIGKCLGDLPLVTLYSFVYAVSFMTVAAPASTFADFYACIFLYEWCLFGVGYVSSVMFDADQNGLLLSVVASLLGGLAVQKDSVTKLICWSSWFGEPLFTSEVRLDLQPPRASFVIQTYADGAHGFKLDRFAYNLWILFVYAMALRALAYVILLRKKRVKLGRAL